jgi:DNA primase
MNIKQAKEIPIQRVVEALGGEVTKIDNAHQEIWYKAPRGEKTASFKIHEGKNVWFDHGTGKGGDVINLVQAYLGLKTVSEALEWLSSFTGNVTPTQEQRPIQKQPEGREAKYLLVKEKRLSYLPMLSYLNERGISKETALLYCSEVYFRRSDQKPGDQKRPLFGIGFFTDDPETREVRGIQGNFKAVIGNKTISTICRAETKPQNLHAFEGFFDFLTFAETVGLDPDDAAIVLNSASLAGAAIEKIKSDPRFSELQNVFTWFDNDTRGEEITQIFADELLQFCRTGDMSPNYQDSEDLNAFWMNARKSGIKPAWLVPKNRNISNTIKSQPVNGLERGI